MEAVLVAEVEVYFSVRPLNLSQQWSVDQMVPIFQYVPRYIKIEQRIEVSNCRQDASSFLVCSDDKY